MGRAAAGRRDFSFQRAEDPHRALPRGGGGGGGGGGGASVKTESLPGTGDNGQRSRTVPGSWTESAAGSTVSSDLGTKSYRHVIPGLSSAPSDVHSGVVPSTTASTDFAYQEDPRKKSRGYRRG